MDKAHQIRKLDDELLMVESTSKVFATAPDKVEQWKDLSRYLELNQRYGELLTKFVNLEWNRN